MRISPKEHDLSRCISNEVSRLSLQNPYLEESGELVATNGHILAVIPGVKGEEDSPGWVSLEAIKAAKGEEIKANGSLVLLDGRSFPRPNLPVDGPMAPRYPDWKKIRDGAALEVKPVVTFNADYILACAKAIKAGSTMPRTVMLWARPGKESECAWFITAGGDGKSETPDLTLPHAVIMPARR